MSVQLAAAKRLHAADEPAAPVNQSAVMRALKLMGFHSRKTFTEHGALQAETPNDAGEIFLTLNAESLKALQTLIRGQEVRLSFYTRGAAQVGVSVGKDE